MDKVLEKIENKVLSLKKDMVNIAESNISYFAKEKSISALKIYLKAYIIESIRYDGIVYKKCIDCRNYRPNFHYKEYSLEKSYDDDGKCTVDDSVSFGRFECHLQDKVYTKKYKDLSAYEYISMDEKIKKDINKFIESILNKD